MTGMANINDRRLADYAERLRRLHNTVRPLLPAVQQDELLELAVGVGLLVTAGSDGSPACLCGHPRTGTEPIPSSAWTAGTPPAPSRTAGNTNTSSSRTPGPAMYEYAARLSKVIDGDTLDLVVSLGFDIHIKQRIRLLGINCAEHGTIAGDDATAFTKAWIAEHGPDLTVRTVKDRREKYGRYLGQVLVAGHILNQDLVTAGLAVDYDGGKRTLPAQPGEPGPAQPVR